jgi:hypothetical protein
MRLYSRRTIVCACSLSNARDRVRPYYVAPATLPRIFFLSFSVVLCVYHSATKSRSIVPLFSLAVRRIGQSTHQSSLNVGPRWQRMMFLGILVPVPIFPVSALIRSWPSCNAYLAMLSADERLHRSPFRKQQIPCIQHLRHTRATTFSVRLAV